MRLTNKQQLDIVELAKKRKWDPANLSRAQHRILAMQVQPNLMKAGTDALKSRARTLVRKVAAWVRDANEEICRNCPHDKSVILKNGELGCNACGCSGKFLESKLQDPTWFCPLTVKGKRVDPANIDPEDPPTWTNWGKPLKGKPDAV